MDDVLSTLQMLPPPAATPWSGTPGQTILSKINRKENEALTLKLPLFWYDPRWCKLSTGKADSLATAVSRHDILVSALQSDLSGSESEPQFHLPLELPQSDQDNAAEDRDEDDEEPKPPKYFSRIVPYRPERYGVSPTDFDNATVIDVRLMMPRDTSGRFAYSPEQIARWESRPDSEPISENWVPAATFPPDVVSFEHLSSKLDQLRQLAPSAAVFTSIGPFRLEEEIPRLVSAKPDGLIVRFDQVALDPLQLAALTRRARQLMNAAQGQKMPFWIVPGPVTPDDAVKLVALGADAIGIDSWCNPLLKSADQDSDDDSRETDVDELVDEILADRIERFSGLYLSLQRVPPKERLGSFSAIWAKALNIKALR